MDPDQRVAYETEMTRLRIEASLAQKAAMQAAMEGKGLRVVVDCSYVTQVDELHAPRFGERAAEITKSAHVRSLAKQVEIAMGLNRRCGGWGRVLLLVGLLDVQSCCVFFKGRAVPSTHQRTDPQPHIQQKYVP